MNYLAGITDINNRGLSGLTRSSSRYASVLAAGVAEVVAIPAGAKHVLFSANADFWANFDAAAAVPTTEVADGSASYLNPGLIELGTATTIGLISEYAAKIQMSFYG
ncbi:putative NAD/NADP transhydrogenase alpha subunit-like protein [Gammaproteobacteria bacterium]